MLGCEILFSDEDRALALQAMIEKQTGAPCPCKQGKSCPILPMGKLPVALQARPPVVGLSA